MDSAIKPKELCSVVINYILQHFDKPHLLLTLL